MRSLTLLSAPLIRSKAIHFESSIQKSTQNWINESIGHYLGGMQSILTLSVQWFNRSSEAINVF